MATLNDVAREAGVSPTAVSRYLNNRIELPEETRTRIDRAVELLNYRPNLLAKRLSTGKAEAIGIVLPKINNPFFSELAGAVEMEAAERGYAVYITSSHGERDRELSALNQLHDRHVDGLLLLTEHPDDGTLAEALARHDKVVLLDEDVPGVHLPRVFSDNEEGAYIGARYLIENGHQDIALVVGPEHMLSVDERVAGFKRALNEAGIAGRAEWIMHGDYTHDFGYACAERLIAGEERPTAIFAASDYIALGVLKLFTERGISVPGDMSVLGFDDMPMVDLLNPPLTTIRQPIHAFGRMGVKLLLDLLEGRDVPPVTRLPVELVVRQSVADLKTMRPK